MELTKFLGVLAAVLPAVYGAPSGSLTELHPKMLEAMKRDLGLDAEQASARVAREIDASEVIEALRTSAGASFAGGWVTDDGATVNVGVTDEALAEEVTAAGATPVIVANSLTKLEEAKEALDKLTSAEVSALDSSSSTSGVAAWYVDVIANKLVLEATSEGTSNAATLASEVGLADGEFEVRDVEELPSTFATIQGGDAYYIGGGRCSVGFSVTTGFVTAGHCGRTGTAVTSGSGERLGQFGGSIFPGSGDLAYVRTTAGHTLRPYINSYGGGSLPVTGSTVSPVGSSVCRSGSTTGVHCGTIRQTGVTVNYPEGSVAGLTGTTVCAEPGDSGGSFYTGSQAQGVTSGGSGNCRTGGTTYFQPVNRILSNWGLTLVRA
jgi:hypothetical protein